MNNFDLKKTLSTMVICVDSREKPTAEAKKRWESFGVPYRIQGLRSGDYTAEFILPNGETFSLENHALIERKLGISEICGNFAKTVPDSSVNLSVSKKQEQRRISSLRGLAGRQYTIIGTTPKWLHRPL